MKFLKLNLVFIFLITSFSCTTLPSQNIKTDIYKITVDDSYVFKGKKDAKVTLVEYFDFKCSVCAKSRSTIDSLLTKNPNTLKVVYKHYPFINDMSTQLAVLFEKVALENKDKALEVFNYIFDHQADIKTSDDIKEIEKKFNVKEITDKEKDSINKKIADNKQEAKDFSIQGTPTFVLNNKILFKGYTTEEALTTAINSLN